MGVERGMCTYCHGSVVFRWVRTVSWSVDQWDCIGLKNVGVVAASQRNVSCTSNRSMEALDQLTVWLHAVTLVLGKRLNLENPLEVTPLAQASPGPPCQL